VDGAHSTHYGSEMEYGVCTAHRALTNGNIANISNDLFVAYRCIEGRMVDYINDPNVFASLVKAVSEMRTLIVVHQHEVVRGNRWDAEKLTMNPLPPVTTKILESVCISEGQRRTLIWRAVAK
jgi:hypothetical protein